MRRFSLYFLVIVFLGACKEDENLTLAEFPQKWVFSGISSSWEANPVINPIADSLYYYELNENGTFTKFIG